MDIKIYTHNEKKDLVKKMEKISNKMHYKLIYFCPKTDVRKIYDEILGSLAEKGILIENKKELK